MDWGFIEDNWAQMRGNLLRQWGRLTDRELDAIAGHRESRFIEDVSTTASGSSNVKQKKG